MNFLVKMIIPAVVFLIINKIQNDKELLYSFVSLATLVSCPLGIIIILLVSMDPLRPRD